MSNSEIKESIGVPSFTQAEIRAIHLELSPTRWREKGCRACFNNNEWLIEITKEERDGFDVAHATKDEIVQFFIKTGRVYLYSGRSDSHEGTGFRLVPKRKDSANPYDKIQLPLEETLKKKGESITERREQIKALVESLVKEDERLQTRGKEMQEYKWGIPRKVLDGRTIQDIIEELKRIF